MITKFVIYQAYADRHIKVGSDDSLEDAIVRAKEIYYKEKILRIVYKYEIIVAEVRYANETNQRRDFHIDSHIRWDSYL